MKCSLSFVLFGLTRSANQEACHFADRLTDFLPLRRKEADWFLKPAAAWRQLQWSKKGRRGE
jgi:hypothetical protein